MNELGVVCAGVGNDVTRVVTVETVGSDAMDGATDILPSTDTKKIQQTRHK